jgi:hypothetical protein
MEKEIKAEGKENNQSTDTIKSWINNDQGYYKMINDMLKEIVEQGESTVGDKDTRSDAAIHLADAIKELFEEDMPELTGAYSDLLTHALADVRWDDIANDIVVEYNLENKTKESPEETK